jgi:NAD(P)-dependent dehydrogenase (short-subunit alcohol dehydrogenase family)
MTAEVRRIKAAFETALTAFGRIEVWVNNAGYGAFDPIEAASRAQVHGNDPMHHDVWELILLPVN